MDVGPDQLLKNILCVRISSASLCVQLSLVKGEAHSVLY